MTAFAWAQAPLPGAPGQEQGPPPTVAVPVLPPSGAAAAQPPFPSAVEGQKKLAVPLSTESMGFDERHVDGQIDRAQRMADDRMKGMQLGQEGLPGADTTAYRGDLEDMAAIQRRIRLLELKQREADLAVKLWATVYDGKREEQAAKAPDTREADAGVSAKLVAAQAEEAARKAADAVPPPKVVSIVGSGPDMRAKLLVPGQGEAVVTAGSRLPGGLIVTRISADGVLVTDGKGKTFALGLGNRVAASASPAVATPAAAAGIAGMPPGFPRPVMAAPPSGR
jgi:type IV pilus biogenesis protein PilP